jgi:hypothetical protein
MVGPRGPPVAGLPDACDARQPLPEPWSNPMIQAGPTRAYPHLRVITRGGRDAVPGR